MRKLAFRDINKVKYIITAFAAEEDETVDQYMQEMRNEIFSSQIAIMGQLNKQDDKIKDIQRMIT